MTEAEMEHRRAIYIKYETARNNDKDFFKSENYEWELGTMVACVFLKDFAMYKDETMTCYGIPVRINFHDSWKIELWKKVE